MDHIEQGHHQAAELRGLITEVAGLIGYTVEPPAPGANYRDAVRLHGPDRAALVVTRPSNNPRRISVYGAYPPETDRATSSLSSHRITVAIGRGAPAIAGEVQRRLLPGYLADLSERLEALRARHDAATARENVAAELQAAVPGLRRGIESDSRVTLTYYGAASSGPNGSVEIFGQGDQVSITLSGPANLLLPAFTTVLTDRDLPPAPPQDH